MPFPSLRSRPGTAAGNRRSVMIDRDSPFAKVSGTGTGTGICSADMVLPTTTRETTLERLSLHLTKSNGDDFDPLFTTEPEEIVSRRQSAATKKSEDQEQEVKSASTPAALSSTKFMHHERGREEQKEPQQQPPTSQLNPDLDQEVLVRPQRFSLLKFRHASDPQLSSRFKKAMSTVSPPQPLQPPETQPVAPTIITTAPTSHNLEESSNKGSIHKLFGRAPSPLRKNHSLRQSIFGEPKSQLTAPHSSHGVVSSTPNLTDQRPATHNGQSLPSVSSAFAPPAYGDESASQLAIPVDRLSDSSRSDGSENRVYAQTTTVHHISTTTTFFKLKRKKKDKGPLFPLPERLPPPSGRTSFSRAPQASNGGRTSMSPGRRSNAGIRFDTPTTQGSASASPTHSTLALTNAPFGSPGPSVLRKDSNHSGQFTPPTTLLPPSRLGARGRSSTMSSLGRSAEKLSESLPQPPGSTRTSTSTTGRRSFGDLLSLPHRLRQNSVPPARHGSGNTPGTPGSKSNSLQIPREPEPELIYPKREEHDTPATYLERLEAAVPRGSMATILCKTGEDFSKTCLRKYMRGFSYFGESLDMAVRKMLMEVELPKETQQIDRLLAGFADRYYECNPGIFLSTDETAFVAFSILLLHSDTHNKSNKRKMTKHDYFKNTKQGPAHQTSADILDCFYDNICYTPFIHFEDEVAINSHRQSVPKQKKSLIRTKSSEKLRGPVDPYLLILDNKLDALKPALKDVMETEDTYRNCGTAAGFECNDLYKAFAKSAVLQIVSARSRPDAFSTQATISNPAEAQAGLISLKVAKVGLLWRKDPKKKKKAPQRPWQEWGAILTDSKLYFFRDAGIVRRLITQFESHSRVPGRAALVFKPPLQSWDPDAWMNMDDAVALLDANYTRHKNAFTFIKHGGLEEVFLANTEADMNDWVGKLNYAATFRTAGIRMRGQLGTTYEGRQILRKDSEISTLSIETPVKESPNPAQRMDAQSWEISFYRRQLINERISDFDEKIAVAQKELDHLLRNARHLLVLLPIQAKTREALILAAGRMSAKLRWTRVELWRTRTHREILAKDLEQEGATDFPAPKVATPQTVTPVKSHQSLLRTTTDTSHQTLSPVSSIPPTSRGASQSLKDNARQSTPEPKAISPSTSPALSQRGFGNLESQSLKRKASIIASQKIKPDDEDPERPVLKDTFLVGLDGAPSSKEKDKRRDASDSDRDRVGAISPEFNKRDRGGSVRRSLQRTLRDSHGSLTHHAPSIHRHKKGRESGSSLLSDDGTRSSGGDSNELKRGTGSFILHGKKASVITMSGEWQAMSNEDRLKLRIEEKKDGNDENAVEDGAASNVSRRSSLVPPEELAPRVSTNTATTDDEFVDASDIPEDGNLSVDSEPKRPSYYMDATSSPLKDEFTASEVDDDEHVLEKGKGKAKVKDDSEDDDDDDDDSDDSS